MLFAQRKFLTPQVYFSFPILPVQSVYSSVVVPSMLSFLRHRAFQSLSGPTLSPLGSLRPFSTQFPSSARKTASGNKVNDSYDTATVITDDASSFPDQKDHQQGKTEVTQSVLPRASNFNLIKRILCVRRTVNMTARGKVNSQSVLMVVGNGNGIAGYGEGKSYEYKKALALAEAHAVRDMRPVERYDRRTVYHDVYQKFKATEIILRARAPGFGIRANRYIHEICRCAGIRDISGKVRGSRTPMNVIKATFDAIHSQRLPEEIARGRGKRLVDVHHALYGARK